MLGSLEQAKSYLEANILQYLISLAALASCLENQAKQITCGIALGKKVIASRLYAALGVESDLCMNHMGP